MVGSVVGFLAIVTMAVVVSIAASIDWRPVVNRLAALALMLMFLYRTSTLLPGPVKTVGRAVGRGVVRIAKRKRQ